MNNTRIVIGDIDLDLPDTFSGIAQTKQGPNIGDLTTRAFNVTETITIPDTPTNQSVYELSNKVQSETDVPYTRRTAKIIQNGIEVESNGVERLQQAGDGFTIYIQSGAKLFFDTIGDKMLSELSGFVNTTGTIINSGRRAATSGVIYPVAYYGVDAGNPVYTGLPYVYDLSILNNIISDAGYTRSGSIFSNTKFSKTVTGAFSSKTGYVSSFIDDRRVSVVATSTQVIAVSTNHAVNFAGISQQGVNPIGYWDGTNKYLSSDPRLPNDYVLFKTKLKLVIKITVDLSDPTNSVDIVFRTYDSSGTFLGGEVIVATAVQSGTYSFDDNTGVYDLAFRNGGYQRLEIAYNSGTTPFNVTVNNASMDLEPSGSTGASFSGPISPFYDDFASLLPDIKQKDFIKDIMISYGLIATESNGTITFTSFDEIIADRASALDWTNKRVIDKLNDRIMYSAFNYAQTNNFRYTNVDDLVSTDYGIGIFEIANENIQEVKDIYKSIYAAARTSFINNLIVADINAFDDSGVTYPDIVNKSSNRKLLVRDKYSYEPSVTYMDGVSYSDYKAVYFDDPNQTYSMKFQQFLDDNYPLFIEALQKAKVCFFKYQLNETDIAGFNFTKLVFDGDTYYLANKIFNFIPGRTTQVQIFKAS